MTAGTVVITGGILATVILLCIIAVLCYCRLQYYCCKKHGTDSDTVSASPSQHACNECSAPGPDGCLPTTPLALSSPPAPLRSHCPSCSPYNSPFYVRSTEEALNGGERITYMPTHFDNPSLSLPLPKMRSTPLTTRSTLNFYANRRAISTEV